MTQTIHTHHQIPPNFTTSKAITKNPPINKLTKILIRNINLYKFDYNQLKYIFRRARLDCDIKVPTVKKRLYKLPTRQDLNQFYNTIQNPIHKLIFEFLQGTGLRISELTNLKISEIDFSNNTIFVKQGKNYKDRITLMSNNLKEKLEIYLTNKNQNTYLFESNRYTKFTTRRIQQLCSIYSKKADIETPITCHTFRHIWNTSLANANVPREKREILAGHSHGSKTQEIYTHLAIDGFKDEILKVLNSSISNG